MHIVQSELNRYLGQRLRQRREVVNHSPKTLALALGLSPEQVRGYERGDEPLPGAMLFYAGQVLDVHHTWFYEPFEYCSGETVEARTSEACCLPLPEIEIADLLYYVYRIRCSQHRHGLCQFAQVLKNQTK